MAFAQITNGLVSDISDEAPDDTWVLFSGAVAVGWQYSNNTFSPPPVIVAPPTPPTAQQILVGSAFSALTKSDTTMLRVQEAITLGLTTATTADVVAFVQYRKALRAIVDGTDTTSTSLPAQPAYPANT